jgi:hypothetical protein
MLSDNWNYWPLSCFKAFIYPLIIFIAALSTTYLEASIFIILLNLAIAFLVKNDDVATMSRKSYASVMCWVIGIAILWQRILLYPSDEE